MWYKGVPLDLTRQVKPLAVRSRAESLGWQRVENGNGKVAVYRSPNDALRQLLVPLDPRFDDYAERIAEVVDTLARFEERPSQDVLTLLLLPSADLISLAPAGMLTEPDIFALGLAADLLEGIHRALAAVAASLLEPQPCHEWPLPAEAERFVQSCRLVQVEGARRTAVVALPLRVEPWEGQWRPKGQPFARTVSMGLMETLDRLAQAVSQGQVEDLLQSDRAPLLSANLCEALAFLQPIAGRGSLSISVSWCAGVALPADRRMPAMVLLDTEAFSAADQLASRLRLSGRVQPTWHVGFVEGLFGHAGADDRPAGLVYVAITQADQVLHAQLTLSADEYALASTAHLNNIPVYFRGVLYRFSEMYRVEQVGPFLLVQRPSLAQQAS